MTEQFQLLGDPVTQSVSPAIHAEAFRVWDVDALYRAVQVSATEFEPAIRDPGVRGGNVTVPHKLRAASVLDVASASVVATGACNCYWREDGILRGTNTDVGGFVRALDEMGVDAAGARVLLVGAGGAARAAGHALTGLGIRRLEIQNRTPDKARILATLLGWKSSALEGPPSGVYDLVVNATSAGLTPADAPPIDLATVDCGAVLDMVYAPGRTSWVRGARERGLAASDGLAMLVHQAALSLESWFPDRTPPLREMRRAAERALELRTSCP